MAIFDYDKKGIDAYNSVVNEDALVQKGLSVVYAGKKFPSLIPIKSSVVFNKSGKKCEGLRAMLLPLNYEDYGVESEYGYHVIEFLFKKEDLIKFDANAIEINSCKQSIKDRYFFDLPSKAKKDGVRINVDKTKFSEYIQGDGNKVCFNNFKPLVDGIREFIKS